MHAIVWRCSLEASAVILSMHSGLTPGGGRRWLMGPDEQPGRTPLFSPATAHHGRESVPLRAPKERDWRRTPKGEPFPSRVNPLHRMRGPRRCTGLPEQSAHPGGGKNEARVGKDKARGEGRRDAKFLWTVGKRPTEEARYRYGRDTRSALGCTGEGVCEGACRRMREGPLGLQGFGGEAPDVAGLRA